MSVLSAPLQTTKKLQPMRIVGSVTALRGLTVLAEDLPLPVGSLIEIESPSSLSSAQAGHVRVWDGSPTILGEVVGFTKEQAVIMLLGQTTGIRVGDRVAGLQSAQTVAVGSQMLGRCLDGLGRPIDGLGPITDTVAQPISPDPIQALERRRIVEPIYTGIRAVDLMTTLGKGQRIGIFAGPGVGKSTLLGTIAKNAKSDINVIALIGERGREVRDFVEQSLGPEGLARSVVVVATSDESPLLRIRAALVASAIAEFFRDDGHDVMLMMDSITRFAHAQRQVGLSVGEPPATKGYTPSVFASLPLLLERAGAVSGKNGGTITGLYTILVEGDDMTEPIADAARGILDGHLILARKLAQRGHYPAIDVLDSVSRVAPDVCDAKHLAARQHIARLLAAFRDVEDLVQIGAYARGSNALADVAIDFNTRVEELLKQGTNEVEPFTESLSTMIKLALETGEAIRRLSEGGRG